MMTTRPRAIRRIFRVGFASAIAAAALWGAASLCGGGTAEAAIVERVVAVVGERPILLSELRRRARPFLVRIALTVQGTHQQTAAETEMFREVLDRMIDDRLEELAADKAKISVASDEIDRALQNVANSAKITVRELVTEARRQGLSEQDYRDEIRRQVLEGKLINLRVRGRVRVTEQDARTIYQRWVSELGDKAAAADVRLLAIRVGSPEEGAAKIELAKQIVAEARAGADFCSLVNKYSDDAQTKPTCGSRGLQPLAILVQPVQDVVRTLSEGDTSDPVPIGEDAVVIAQLTRAPKVPGFDDVREQMTERAYADAVDRQRKQWLSELRRTTYVDVRL